MSALSKPRLGPPGQLTAEHQAHREGVDTEARERLRKIPAWAAGILDRALAERLIRDEEVPLKPDDVCDLLRHRGWILDSMRALIGAGMIERRDVFYLSWEGREHIARLALDAGDNLAAEVAELQRQLTEAGERPCSA